MDTNGAVAVFIFLGTRDSLFHLRIPEIEPGSWDTQGGYTRIREIPGE